MDRRAFLCAAAALAVAPEAFARRLGGWPVALVTADLESRVLVVERSGRVARSIATLPDPRSIQVVGGTAVVAHTDRGALTLIDTHRLRVRRVLRGLREPRYMAGSYEGRYA